MIRIQYTDNEESRVRLGNPRERAVEFDHGETVTKVSPEVALWAEATLPGVTLVADLPRDYDTLRAAASAAETDEVSGNDDKLTLLDWLDGLDADERDALLDEVA